MAEIKLTAEECALLKAVLAKLALRRRTGEVGIMHGMDRFVSTQLVFKKPERDALALLAAKLGLRSIAEVP